MVYTAQVVGTWCDDRQLLPVREKEYEWANQISGRCVECVCVRDYDDKTVVRTCQHITGKVCGLPTGVARVLRMISGWGEAYQRLLFDP